MKLPNGDRAVVDLRKLVDYCLNPAHAHGGKKARVFRAALGLTAIDGFDLRSALLQAAGSADATIGRTTAHGQLYQVDFLFAWQDREATIRSAWIIGAGDDRPRLVTCFVRRR